MTGTKKEEFKAELLQGHKGAAVEVPFDPAKLWALAARALWPGRRGHLVQGSLNGVRFGSCIVPRSRKFFLLVDEELQEKAGVSVGDTVRVTVEPLVAMAGLKFPNETDGYREARDQLLQAEIDLRARVEQVTAMRRGLPLGGLVKEDYAFEEVAGDGQVRNVRLSELFEGSKTSLFVYSWMYGPKMEYPCPMCSSIIDGLNGNARHLAERINLVVVARSPIERIMSFAKPRGWNSVRLLSSANNRYNADYYGQTAEGDQYPMANVFVRRDGSIHHFWGTEMLYAELEGDPRHMDLMWPLWNVLDATRVGRGDWYPPLNV